MPSMSACLCLAALLALAVPAGIAHAQAPAKPGSQEAFRATDLNGDSRVDREEFHRRSVDVFFLLDRGKKGFLVVEEIEGASPAAFKAADRKADGKFSLDEWTNARFVDFEAADLNKDGTLTFEEVEAYSRAAR